MIRINYVIKLVTPYSRVYIRKRPIEVVKVIKLRLVSAKGAWSYLEKKSSRVTRWPIVRSAIYSLVFGGIIISLIVITLSLMAELISW